MNSAAVQQERGPRRANVKKLKYHSGEGSAFRAVNNMRPHSIVSSLPDAETLESAAQLLVASVRCARLGPALSPLPRRLQDRLIAPAWTQLMLLHALAWPWPLTLALAHSDPGLHQLFQACRLLQPDPVETSMMQTIALCYKDEATLLDVDAGVSCHLRECSERAQVALGYYAALAAPARHSALMLALSAMRAVPPNRLRAILLDPIIGPVPMLHIIASI